MKKLFWIPILFLSLLIALPAWAIPPTPPGWILMGKPIDSTTPPTTGQVLTYSEVTGKWAPAAATGATTFLALTDTPASYATFGGYFVKVNAGATALEFTASTVLPHTLLVSTTHSDTTTGTVTRGDIIVGDSVPSWKELAKGTSGSVLTSGASDVAWTTYYLAGTAAQTYTFPTTTGYLAPNPLTTIGDLPYANSTATPAAYGRIAAVATGSVLASAGTGTAPVWSANPQLTTIELGHATDTTLARSAAGIMTIEGAYVATNPATTTGDLIYASSTATPSALSRLAVGGSAGMFLRSTGTLPAWSTLILPNAGTAYKLAAYTATNTLTELGAVGATGQFLVGATAAIPTWSVTTLTDGTNAFTITNGTAIFTVNSPLILNALPIGGLAVATAANTLGSLAVGLTTQVLVGGGAATVPAWATDLPTAVTIGSGYIYRGGGTDVPVGDGGTGASTLALNGVLYGNGTSAIGATAIGAAGQLLRVGADPFVPAWTTLTMPAAIADGSVFVANAANILSALTWHEAGTKVLTNASGTISWEDAAAPAGHAIVGASHTLAAATTGTILRATAADAFAFTTSTWVDAYPIGSIPHATTAANTMTALLPGAVGSFLMSNGTGANLSYLAAGTAGQVLVGAGATTIPVWTTLNGTGTPVGTGTPTFTGSVILPSANADPQTTAGSIVHDSTVTNFTGGALRYYNGAAIKQLIDMTAATAEACTEAQAIVYDASADLWKCGSVAAGNAATVTVIDSTSTTTWVAVFDAQTGDLAVKTDGGLTYNASTGMLSATGLTGPLTGNASSATYASATTITDDTSTAATMYPLWVTANTGNLPTKVSSSKLSFRPDTGILTATGFAGPLTGAVTGNASSSTYASATTITDDTATAATMYPVWVTANTGNLPTKVSSSKLSFRPDTGILTATGFAGPLTGNVTGNASGTAATVTGATQASITSAANLVTVGTITTGIWDATTIAADAGGTGHQLYVIGDILYADSTTTLARLADVAVASYLRSGGVGAVPVWSTLKLPNSGTIYKLAAYTAANTLSELDAVGATGKVLTGVTGAIPAWSTSTYADTYAIGTLLHASAANTVTGLAAGTNGQILLGVTGAAPAWGTDLATATTIGTAYIYRVGGTDVSVADGGTGLSSGTEGGIPWYTTTTAMASSALLASNAIMVGGGIDAAPNTITSTATLGYILTAQGAGVAPIWATPAAATVHVVLDSTVHSDTTTGTVASGDLIVGSAAPAKWTKLATSAAQGPVLVAGGTGVAPSWSVGFTVDADGDAVAKSVTITKASGVAGEVQIYNDYLTQTYGVIFKGPTGTMGAAYTLQYPNAAPTTGQIAAYGTPMTWVLPVIQSAGTQNSFSNAVVQGGLLYGYAANDIRSTTGAMTQYGVIYGGGTGAPASTAAGTTGQAFIGVTGAAPVWGTVPATAGGTGVANNVASTLTISGAYPLAFTLAASAGVNLSNFPTATSTYIKPSATTIVPLGTGAIQAAISAATAGDTLILSSGTYTITSAINVDRWLNIVGQGNAGLMSATETDVHGTLIYCVTDGVTMFNITSSNVRIANMSILHAGATASKVVATAENLDGLTFTNLDIIMSTTAGAATAGAKTAFDILGSTAIFRDVVMRVRSTNSTAYGIYAHNTASTSAARIVDVHTCYAYTDGGLTRSTPYWVYNNNNVLTITMNLFNSTGITTEATANDDAAAATSTTSNAAVLNVYSSTLDGKDTDLYRDGTNVVTVYGGIFINNAYTAGITFGGTVAASIFTGTITNAANVAMLNESTDTTCFPAFLTDSTAGNFPLKTVSSLTFNSNTGLLSATGLAGAFNGTVGATTPAAGTFTTLTANAVSSLTLGSTTGPVKGSAIFWGATSGSSVLSAPDVAGSATAIVLPSTAGTLQLTTGSPAGFIIASQAIGDLLYASSTTAWARLGIQAAGYILAGGTTPAWSNAPQITTIELGAAADTTLARSGAGDVTIEGNVIYRAAGTDVPVTDGGTGLSAGTEGGIPWYSTTTVMASSALLAANAVMIGGGVDAAPSTITAATTTTHALFATAGAPAFRAVADGDLPKTITGMTITASGVITASAGAVIADGQTLTFDEAATDPNDADVILSGAHGVLTIAAANGANNENLTIDLDAASNVVTFNSGTSATFTFTPAVTITGDLTLGGDIIAGDGNTDLIIQSDNEASDTVKIQVRDTEPGGWADILVATSGASPTLALTGDGGITIVSSGSTVTVESVVFTGGAISSATTLAMGGALSGVTTATLTHTAPDITLIDSDTGAAGTGNLLFASAGTQDVVGTIQVDVAGSATTFVEIDGVSETVDILKSLVVSTSILPSAAGATAIGTTALPFSSIFIGDAATNNVQLINTAAASAVVLTLPSTTGTLARLEDKISDLAAVTSAELYGKISDEVGTGYAVFNTAPTFVTSIAPTVAGATTIGTTALEWGNVYLTDSAVIYGQADQSNSLTSSATGWTAALSFAIGPAAPDEVRPTLTIRGDADSDAADTTEALTITLTPNSNPVLATWGFTSTQSAGYAFDKMVTFSGGATATTFTGNVSGSAATLTGTLANVAASTSANLATCLSDEQGTGVAIFSDSPTFVDDITIAAAGVKLTGANGVLTILGLGDGADENLTIDFNTTTDKVIFNSGTSATFTFTPAVTVTGHVTLEGVTSTGATGTGKLVFDTTPTLVTPVIGAATGTSLYATGVVDGLAPIVITATSAGYTISSTTSKSGYFFTNPTAAAAAFIFNLPTAAAGLQYCIVNGAAKTGVLTVNAVGAGQFIDLDGVLSADDGYVHTAGAAGDMACFIGVDATHWKAIPTKGTWTLD